MVVNDELLITKQRPRENAVQHGIGALSDRELLQIILRTGTRQVSSSNLAAQMITKFGNLAFISQASIEELMSLHGVGQVKAIEILAAFEIGQRGMAQRRLRHGVVLSSQEIGLQMVRRLRGCQQEQLIAIYLDTKNEIIQECLVFQGSLNSSVAHPREIYHHAVILSAARLIVVHNHPSGHTDPSTNDINFTRRLVKCGEIMGIECLDHLIIGHNQYLSLREEKLM